MAKIESPMAKAGRVGHKATAFFALMLLAGSFQFALTAPSAQAEGEKPDVTLTEKMPQATKNGDTVTPSSSLVTGTASSGRTAASGESDAEAEAVNNILDAPVLPVNPPEVTDVSTASKTRVQRHVSLLNNSASDAGSVSENFDYGVYIFSQRLLDSYRQRVKDAIETARELSLPVETKQVDVLLREAQAHKRRFDVLYPSPNTQESRQGLLEWEQSRKALLHALALVSASPRVEGRAIWLDRGSIIQSANADGLRQLMQRLKHAGINIVYFETLNAGFPIYPSKILQPNPLVQGWDPLAVAVAEGKQLGMEVHAWVWAFAVGNRRHNPLIGMPNDYAGPILTSHNMASEALRNRNQGLSVDSRQHEFWLSPASPKARALLLSVYQEIVSNYDVDGIHLDYIRYPFQTPGNRMGYEAAGRNGFHQATGRSLDTMDSETARLWTAWKTAQVNSFVKQVSTTLKQIRPNLQISAAVFPMRRAARLAAIQQDWETWINNGWVDTLSPMSYTTDPRRLQSLYEAVYNSPQRHPMIYPGVAMNHLDEGQLVLQLEALREKGSLGSTLFAGAHLDANKVEALASGPFKRADSLPPHQDIFASLAAVLADYRQTFERVLAASQSKPFPTEATQQVRSALDALNTDLTVAKGGKRSPFDIIPEDRLQTLQQGYEALQAATRSWLSEDRAQNPWRARYFDRTLYTLSELLAYMSDKNATSVAHRAPPHDTASSETTPSITTKDPETSPSPGNTTKVVAKP